MDEQTVRNSDQKFWSEIFALRGSVTPIVLVRVLWFGAIAGLLYLVDSQIDLTLGRDLGPYEVAGAVLSLLLVFRTNAGYDRWYEGRKLWGQIVNHSRNMAITVLTHGPDDPAWRESVIRWIAAFGHVTRASLRGEAVPSEVRALLGEAWSEEISRAKHRPSFVAYRIGQFLRHACDEMGMDRLGFLEADRERAWLIEFEGGCERIRNTPIPLAYSINIRRLMFVYLIFVPFAILDHLQGIEWLTPIVAMLIASPILAMDQIAVELEKPFATNSLNHLPLDGITTQIESELLALLAQSRDGLERLPLN